MRPSPKTFLTGLSIAAMSAVLLGASVSTSAKVSVQSSTSMSTSHTHSTPSSMWAFFTIGNRVQLCLQERREAGYFNRTLTRPQRRALQLQFRLCVHSAVNANRGSSSSRMSSSVSSGSMSSTSSLSSSSSSMSNSSASSTSSVSSSSVSSTSSGMSSSASSTSSMGVVNVTISQFAYAPSTITIKKGTTVRWTNDDNAPHTVTRNGNLGPRSPVLWYDDEFSYTFNETGTFNYHCAIHPSMHATVIVTD